MKLDKSKLYGFKTMNEQSWESLSGTSMQSGLGSQLGAKIGAKALSPVEAKAK